MFPYELAVDAAPIYPAVVSTALTGANNDLTYTVSLEYENVSVTYVDPAGNDAALGVVVVGRDITVNLATGGAGAITSTAAQIKTAIDANADAHGLVAVANAAANSGAGVVTAMAKLNLRPEYGGVKAVGVEPAELAAIGVVWDTDVPDTATLVVANGGRNLLSITKGAPDAGHYAVLEAAVDSAGSAISGEAVPFHLDGDVTATVALVDGTEAIENACVVTLHEADQN